MVLKDDWSFRLSDFKSKDWKIGDNRKTVQSLSVADEEVLADDVSRFSKQHLRVCNLIIIILEVTNYIRKTPYINPKTLKP
jgi:hypothetical protein